MTTLSPFQLLEINLISAQDIAKVSRSMKTYAMAWVHPDRKLTTRVDNQSGTNPTWNDKFVFRVDNQFLQSDMSAIMIEIYAVHWFRDVHVGTVRVLVGNLIPPHSQNHIGMRFVALQVRRPSGRPQGILNVGVTLLDSTMRSMPLYTQLSASAVGYQKLMGQDRDGTKDSTEAQLRRTRSEKSDGKSNPLFIHNGSDVGSIVVPKKKGKKIVYDKPLSIVDGTATSDLGLAVKLKAQEGKAESVLSYASSTRPRGRKRSNKKTPSTASQSDIGISMGPKSKQMNYNNGKMGRKKAGSDVGGMKGIHGKNNWLPPSGANAIDNHIKREKQKQPYFRGYPIAKDFAAGSVWSESEVGPSPSEVAAAIAEDCKYRHGDDGRSSMLDDKWSMDESEGVQTKLERWRAEMPTTYEHSRTSDSSSTIFAASKHRRRHTDGGVGGKFSCFGNICGYECSIVCGRDKPDDKKRKKKAGGNKHIVRTPPSIDSVSTYF